MTNETHPRRRAARRSSSPAARLALAAPALAAGALCVVAAPARAEAQVIDRFALHFEGGVGTMLPTHQRANLGYDQLNVQGTVRLAFTLFDPLAIQVSAGQWFFFANDASGGTGGLVPVTGGLRVEPAIGPGRLFLDGNVGVGLTGGDVRLAFDVGLGYQFTIARVLGIGPVVRYGHVVQDSSSLLPHDAQFWSAGLALTLRVPPPARAASVAAPPPPPPRPDTDRDGVVDPADLCVTEPAGEHPDSSRLGCPIGDADADTVLDNIDQCRTVPRGEHADPNRPGCPDVDEDGDGVFNHDDQCVTEPAGMHPDPARIGCPTPDRDGDTVPDATDHCPDQRGAPHPDPNRNGCPGLVEVRGGLIRINSPVFFATNRDRILPRSFPVLLAVADAMRASPEIRRVVVEGHTDDVGNDAANMSLSSRRANSVMAWLTQHGIEASRLEARGLGETQPVVQVAAGARRREAETARSQNRRVEFHIVDPAPPAAQPPAGAAPASPAP